MLHSSVWSWWEGAAGSDKRPKIFLCSRCTPPVLLLPAAPSFPCLLALGASQASPLMFATSQQYFNMAVILIFAHDENGSAGIILNRCVGKGCPPGHSALVLWQFGT